MSQSCVREGLLKVCVIIHFGTQVRDPVTCAQFASFRKPSQTLQGSPSLSSLWPSPDLQTWGIWSLLPQTRGPAAWG